MATIPQQLQFSLAASSRGNPEEPRLTIVHSGDMITRFQMLPKVCQQGGHTNSQRNEWYIIKNLATGTVSKGPKVEAIQVSANISRVKSDFNAFMWHVIWDY